MSRPVGCTSRPSIAKDSRFTRKLLFLAPPKPLAAERVPAFQPISRSYSVATPRKSPISDPTLMGLGCATRSLQPRQPYQLRNRWQTGTKPRLTICHAGTHDQIRPNTRPILPCTYHHRRELREPMNSTTSTISLYHDLRRAFYYETRSSPGSTDWTSRSRPS